MTAASNISPVDSQPKIRRAVAALAYATLAVLLLLQPELAMAQFEKATTTVQKIKDWLWLIIPVIGLVSAGIIGILYSFDVIRKETAYQWAVGIVFSGAIAGGIIKLVFG
ncbi:TrbC/VirB2 family protein [Achromobacter sp. MY14]|uniref:TrbC/VirB2 family protein n=1 Tax=Achromobacter TaxID=222 RepID=UPI001E44D1A6|nr:TrbC/VirB2 family protein [Achromobacter sp. MY14]MCD0501370.1 TrbC/VirB2 family protein [Achromobacter sp. MY14]